MKAHAASPPFASFALCMFRSNESLYHNTIRWIGTRRCNHSDVSRKSVHFISQTEKMERLSFQRVYKKVYEGRMAQCLVTNDVISSIEPSSPEALAVFWTQDFPHTPLIWVHRSCFPQDNDRSLFFSGKTLLSLAVIPR